MAVRLISLLMITLFIGACTAQAPNSLSPHFLGEWHGLSDERFSYHFYEDGRYVSTYVVTGEINDEGHYKVLGQDDPNNIYILTREIWYRPHEDGYSYSYKKLEWEDTMFGKPSIDIFSGGPIIPGFSEKEWNMPHSIHMQRIRAEQKKYSPKSILGAFSSRSSYIK